MEIYVSPELYIGRPSSSADRIDTEIKCYDILDSLGITYHRADHSPAFTINDCENIEKVLGSKICKNLFLCNRQKTAFYLLLIPGQKTFHTKELSAQLNVSRLSFASGETLNELLLTPPGSASVLGLINDINNNVRLLIDRELTNEEYICCHPCINTSTLRFKTSDLFDKFLPYVHHEATIVDLSGNI